MQITTSDVRKAGETVLEQSRKPLLAAVGAGDLAVTQIAGQLSQLSQLSQRGQRRGQSQLGQLKDLPAGTQAQLRRLQSRVQTRVSEVSPDAVRAAVGAYVAQARTLYVGLAERGEQVSEKVFTKVRTQPQVRRALGGLAGAFDTLEDSIEDTLEADEAKRGGQTGQAEQKPARKTAPRRTTPKTEN